MASHLQTPLADQTRHMVAQAKTLLNEQLRKVLKEEGLAVSGVKAELQTRIIHHIHDLQAAGDITGMNRVKSALYSPRYGYPSYSPSTTTNTPPSSLSPQYPQPVRQPYQSNYNMPSHSSHSGRITFKDSPFYTVVKPLTSVVECKARENTRDTAKVFVNLGADVAEQLQHDRNSRVMVFCAADNTLPPYAQSEIAFPHQVELKCNLDDVKANLRGLKNKPGSTRPADITSLLRKKVGYLNEVQMTYALTTKATPTSQKFFLVVNLVQMKPVEELVAKLRMGKTISKERVISESTATLLFFISNGLTTDNVTVTRRALDNDIVATSTKMSLKCPLSTLRIDTPCRSIGCAHNQCFDAGSYLQLQEQAPTWTCPVCNKYSPFENLAVDLYVDGILKLTSKSEEQVNIEPNGSWSKTSGSDNSRTNNPTPDDDNDENDDDDDDIVELPDSRVSSLKQQAAYSASFTRTPPQSSREDSLASSATRSGKRPASEVIDLTLSDDDDDAPLPKIKRSSTITDTARARFPDTTSWSAIRPPSQPYSPYPDWSNTTL